MPRRPVPDDLVFGRRPIAAILGTTAEGVMFLHRMGRLPAVMIDGGLIANRRALEAAMADWAKQGRHRRSKGTVRPWGQPTATESASEESAA